jgi:hypothetical protein
MDWTESSRISIYPSRTKSLSVLLWVCESEGTESRTKRIEIDARKKRREVKRKEVKRSKEK